MAFHLAELYWLLLGFEKLDPLQPSVAFLAYLEVLQLLLIDFQGSFGSEVSYISCQLQDCLGF